MGSRKTVSPLIRTITQVGLAYRPHPTQIVLPHPTRDALEKTLWQGSPDEQYGRPFQYYQQLQDLDFLAAWAKVAVPVLVLHGEFDWIMSASDLQLLSSVVNGNSPGSAEYVELPQTGHTFEHYASMEAAFAVGRCHSMMPSLGVYKIGSSPTAKGPRRMPSEATAIS